jgi:hypothetical protein
LFGAANQATKKIAKRKYNMALDPRRKILTHNNQPKICGRDRGGTGEEI